MGVFIDTFVILTLTALVILSTGALCKRDGSRAGTGSFDSGVWFAFGEVFIAICMLFFAPTTIIGWYYFGEVNVRHLLLAKSRKGSAFSWWFVYWLVPDRK